MAKDNLPISANPISLPEPSTPQNERSVSMSNALTRGAQGLNLAQKRVVSLALGCFDSKVAKYSYLVQNTGGWEVILHAQDYADIYGLDINTAYDQLQEGGRSLLKTTWKAAIKGQNQKMKVREGSWFIMAEYGEGEGHIKLVFSPYIAEHLLALRTQFTSYKIKQIAQLKSIYAIRLYECMESWKMPMQSWCPTIEEFQMAMDAPESACKDFGNLRKGIIEPAIKELQAKNNLLVNYTTQKRGRKVTGLIFTYAENPQNSLNFV